MSLQFTAEVTQSQRYFPIIGWGKKRLPTDRQEWSDRSGKVIHTKDIVESILPRECEWTGNWALYKRDGDTDSEGWQYAIDFPQSFSGHKGAFDFVRRRFWRRPGQIIPAFADQGVANCAAFESCLFRDEHAPAEATCFGCFGRLTMLNVARTCIQCNHPFCSRCAKKKEDGRWQCTPCQKREVQKKLAEFSNSADKTAELERMVRATLVTDEADCFAILVGSALADRKEAETLTIQRGSDRNIAEKKRISDKWTNTKEPRQGLLRLCVLSASGVPPGNAQRRLRATVRLPGSNAEVQSSGLVYTAPAPEFNFDCHVMITDDTQPIVVYVEEFNPKFIDVSLAGVSETGNAVIAGILLLRDAHSGLARTVSDNLIYTERGCAMLAAVDPKGLKTPIPGATITVKWALEVRELEKVGFCDNCGRMKNRCDC